MVHLNQENLLPIGREIGAVGHARLRRHVHSAVLGAALCRGNDGHLVAPASQFGKQEPGLPGSGFDPGKPGGVG